MRAEADILYDQIDTWSEKEGKTLTRKALPYMKKKHEGQTRCGSRTPYSIHPLMVAWHAVMAGITDDAIIASMLLHDVCEDCDTCCTSLPMPETVRKTVDYLTYSKRAEESRTDGKERYFKNLEQSPEAVLIKLFDRCNNVSTMSDGFSDARIHRYLEETEHFVMPLFPLAKKYWPQYRSVLWMLEYQMKSVMDMAKRMTKEYMERHDKSDFI